MSKLEKALKSLGAQTLQELRGLDEAGLKKRIVAANDAMRVAAKELEENAAYQGIKEQKSDMEAGMRDVNKRQNAIILVSLSLLEEDGHDGS